MMAPPASSLRRFAAIFFAAYLQQCSAIHHEAAQSSHGGVVAAEVAHHAQADAAASAAAPQGAHDGLNLLLTAAVRALGGKDNDEHMKLDIMAVVLSLGFVIVVALGYAAFTFYRQGGGENGERWAMAAWCCLYGAGIVGTLAVYGVVQERIMAVPYSGQYFGVSIFLVFCNRVVAIFFASGMVLARGEPVGNKAPLWKYLAISFSNVAATTCQYEALKYVSFPVQMLAKSFKMIPVMLWGILISGKRYATRDWLIAGAVTWGVTQFLLTGQISSARHADDHGTSVYGLMLLVAFLACDGFTSTFQELLFKEHQVSKFNQMLYVNSGSAFIALFSLLVSGMGSEAIAFCQAHPEIMVHISALSSAAVAGQFFIYSQVKEFGALVLAATMNLRQVISVLISYLTFGHSITILQLCGLMLVFATLFYKSYMGFCKDDDAKPAKKADVESPGSAKASRPAGENMKASAAA
eukprot:TRINITY_DN83218_c0_g1_i1.p1 TRINITY_DN83218_c0_g1~~TRINITY_DN83218_c0_g1_i1.p1  ORF type:complete len:467 (-),score=111.34 TRINITY_DN83218_c0_g1_i1:99-1499(-)